MRRKAGKCWNNEGAFVFAILLEDGCWMRLLAFLKSVLFTLTSVIEYYPDGHSLFQNRVNRICSAKWIRVDIH
jgi:hypothetical protein